MRFGKQDIFGNYTIINQSANTVILPNAHAVAVLKKQEFEYEFEIHMIVEAAATFSESNELKCAR